MEFTELTTVKETRFYSVDFDKINVEKEKCSDSNPAKDRLVIMPSSPSISGLSQIPEIKVRPPHLGCAARSPALGETPWD